MKNSVGVPVLVMAIRRGSAPIVEALLKSGADPNVRDVDTDLTPLLEALDLSPSDRYRQVAARRGCGRECDEPERRRCPHGHDASDVCGRSREARTSFSSYWTKARTVNAKARFGITALSLAKQSGAEKNKGIIRKLEAAGAME